jgi:hypothetical protein
MDYLDEVLSRYSYFTYKHLTPIIINRGLK